MHSKVGRHKAACDSDARAADAVLLIGDAALAFDGAGYPFSCDLGEIWREVAGVGMIYAVAVVRRDIFEDASLLVSGFFEKSLAAFSQNKKYWTGKAAARFRANCGKEISEDTIGRYYSRLVYKFDDLNFERNFSFVENLRKDGYL